MRAPLPAILLLLSRSALAAEDGPPSRPGLRAEIFAGEARGAPAVVRADSEIHFDWDGAAPDPRLPAGPFAVRWTGTLLATGDGEIRLHVHAAGAVRVAVDGETAVEGEHAEAAWIAGRPLRLEYGEHRLEVEYTRTGPRARVGLYWEGESFALEPVGEAHLLAPAGEPPPGDFERGLRLARTLRCAACHAIPGLPAPPRAPSLARAGASIDPAHLRRRLLSPHEAAPGSRMPELALDPGAVEDIAAFLGAGPAGGHGSGLRAPAVERDIAGGRALVLTRGCLACHTLGGIGLGARHSGGALDDAGSRRDAAALGRLLSAGKGPGDSSVHRPEVPWAKGEREKVVAFLAASTRRPAEEAAGDAPPRGVPDRARGRDLALAHRCAACHDLPGDVPPPSRGPPLHARTEWRLEGSCLAPGGGGPFFPIDEGERRAVEVFLRAVHPATSTAAAEEGRLLLEEKGCTSCHARGAGSGIAAAAPAIAAAHPELRGLEGSWRPPPLSGAGDKLPDDVLRKAARGELAPRRPWLEARMPRFHHAPGEEDAIVRFLAVRDRIPGGAPAGGKAAGPEPLPPAGDLYAAGHVLAGPEGWSCTSCHDIGPHSPGGIAVTARGPDLLRMAERVRRPWFFRWMRDPSRIAPGIEMPGYQAARPGILGGVLDRQIAALWHVFNAETFSLPARAGAVREVAAAPDGPLRIIRDVFRLDGWVPRAMAAGFPGGQNILYDLSLLAPAAWWTDALARQLTQGKTWLWEPAGIPVLPRIPPVAPFALRRAGTLDVPVIREGTAGSLVSWRRAGPARLEMEYELRFPGDVSLRVTESVEPAPTGSGITRILAARGIPEGAEPVLLLALPRETGPSLDGEAVAARSERGALSFPAGAAGPWRRIEDARGLPEGAAIFEGPVERSAAGEARGEISFLMAPAARGGSSPAAPPPVTGPPAVELTVVPGFSAVRLPLDPSIMPTSFAFRADGSVILASLKGDVLALADRDGDGLEETLVPVADLLSAPFGLLVEGGDLLVSHKPEVIRLSDTDGDGWMDLARVVATGWGFSHDYHDWTFGFARSGGGYAVLLGSDYQQGSRPRETSRHRGKALRIFPDGRIEEAARGLRFTVGIAADREGAVFFTDNQGEGNPFNELNHLQDGAAYGVPSLLDAPSDWKAPAEPPAIQLPHPWTRSVNGICFLDAGGRFGPFEGHGVGCEYDNRMLVRFTLEKVRGRYQGACYPLSRVPAAGEGFLGPVACAASPRGELWIGDIRDSGWGGGRNVGAVVRLRLEGDVPAGIREARAWSGGFVLDLTRPLDPAFLSDPSSYSISAYRRVWSGGSATPDRDRHAAAVPEAAVVDGGRAVRLRVSPFRAGFLYEIHVRAAAGAPLWPATAYYTLNEIPED